MVECIRLAIKESLVRDSQEALFCDLEQDTLSGSTGSTQEIPDMIKIC